METKGINIHYIDEGQGPAILFCHGNPTWSLLYSGIIQRLRKKFRCIAIDYPGFGMSDKPDIDSYGYTPKEHSAILLDIVEAMGLDKFHIFVQDWGGPIGLGMAEKIPNKIDKMIIGNTWAWPHKQGTQMYIKSKEFSEKMGGPQAKDRIMQKNSFLKLTIGMLTAGIKKRNPELKDELKAAYLAPFPTPRSRLPTWVFPEQIMGARNFLTEVGDNLGVLTKKECLLFWGKKDIVFPESILEQWKEKLENYRLIELPNANHFFQEDEPELIAKAMEEFL